MSNDEGLVDEYEKLEAQKKEIEAKEGEEELKKLTELADHMFDNGVWQNSKKEMKEMSKRESSRHMFRFGFFIHSKYMNEQMKTLAKEMEGMSNDEIKKLINNFNEKDDGPKGDV